MADLKKCEQCGIADAAVFFSVKKDGAARQEALCMDCAKKRNIPQVQDYLKDRKRQQDVVPVCSACGNLPGMVFISRKTDGGEQKEALCVFCARERKIPQICDLLERMNLSDAELLKLHDAVTGKAQDQKSAALAEKFRRIFQKS